MKKTILGALVAASLVAGPTVATALPIVGSMAVGSAGALINGNDLLDSTIFEPQPLVGISPGVNAGLHTGDYTLIPTGTYGSGGVIDLANLFGFNVDFVGYGKFADVSMAVIVSRTADFAEFYFEGIFTPDLGGPLFVRDPSLSSLRVSLNQTGQSVSYGGSLATPPAGIPEPASLLLLGTGLIGLGLRRRR